MITLTQINGIYASIPPLKPKGRHIDNLFVTCCTWGCQNDNLGCSQWREGCQYDDLLVSLSTQVTLSLELWHRWVITAIQNNARDLSCLPSSQLNHLSKRDPRCLYYSLYKCRKPEVNEERLRPFFNQINRRHKNITWMVKCISNITSCFVESDEYVHQCIWPSLV